VLCPGEKEFNPKEEAMSLSNVSRKMSAAPKEWDNYFGLTVLVVVISAEGIKCGGQSCHIRKPYPVSLLETGGAT